jgi:hypothetical protein
MALGVTGISCRSFTATILLLTRKHSAEGGKRQRKLRAGSDREPPFDSPETSLVANASISRTIMGQVPGSIGKVSAMKMNRKIGVLLLISTVVAVGLTLGLAGAGPASADKGGCPNDAADNGASHANANSAHGSKKQAARGCSVVDPTTDATPTPAPTDEPVTDPTPTPTVEPIPDPTPTPIPADEADVQVIGVSVSALAAGAFEGQFTFRVGGSLLNAGPADTALVDTTFSVAAPSACSVSPADHITVEDSSLPVGVGVYIVRGWIVTCVEPGTHQVTANVSVAIDPAQPVSDPDPGNNTGSATVTLDVVS